MTPRTKAVGAILALLVILALALVAGRVGGASPSAAPRASTVPGPTRAVPTRDPETGLAWVDLATLPAQARQTVLLIDRGGPYPYGKDGVVFENRQHLLPAKATGYYHEYTVPTPGSGDRGARRIVTGDGTRQLFYTGDHYVTFARIRR